jgi:hypothetical protein
MLRSKSVELWVACEHADNAKVSGIGYTTVELAHHLHGFA